MSLIRLFMMSSKVMRSEGICYDFDRFSLYRRDRIQSVSDNAQASVQGAS